ncbi:MFS transporter [Candidatus Gottesmanbacteria bacterium]|nr:MFS transporter [Candidatus Gottesmanbacteria bacterium]
MKQKTIFGFPQNVFILSFVSFLNDIGGQTIKYAIPLFLTNALGVKTSIVGLVEGIGESTPTLFQPISGFLSDKLQKRKPLVLTGQIFRSVLVLLFFATSWWLVLLVRFFDRTGKGIQVAPRDALLSASAGEKTQGKAFGLSRAMDNGGAVVGLTLAAVITIFAGKGIISLNRDIFQSIVLLAVIPAFISIFLILFFVSDVEGSLKKTKLNLSENIGRKFYIFLFIMFLFTLGNSSDAFLILKAQKVGLNISSIFFLLALFSLTASLINIPAGVLSDKIGRKKTLVAGILIYSLVYFGFARSNQISEIIALFLFYGVYCGLTEGVAKAYVADIVPSHKKGTAFGLYNLVIGGTLLPASLIAGFLWQTFSPAASFYFGGILAIVATVGFYLFAK